MIFTCKMFAQNEVMMWGDIYMQHVYGQNEVMIWG